MLDTFFENNWELIAAHTMEFVLFGGLAFSGGFVFARMLLNERMQVAESRVQAYREKLDGRSPDEAAQALKRLESRLNAITGPVLSTAQKAAMLTELRKSSSYVVVGYDTLGVRGQHQASQVASILREAGWQVSMAAVVMDDSTEMPSGIGIRRGTNVGSMSGHEEVEAALRQAGLQFDILMPHDSNKPPERIELIFSDGVDRL